MLSIARAWRANEVFYAGDVVTHEGGTWQATKDVGQAPPGPCWIIIAARGEDARPMVVRGTYDSSATYRAMDVVVKDSSTFVALRDAPGTLPGDGWQMIAAGGRRGVAGEKGERGAQGLKGDRGEVATTIKSWRVDRKAFVATPVMSDGSAGPALSLRELFEEYFRETR
jgi:hypothetical protein